MSAQLFNGLVIAWMVVAVFTFFYLLRKPAPYGRYSDPAWGKMINVKLGWLLMEGPAFLIMLSYLIIDFSNTEDIAKLMMLFYLMHYANRSFIYPLRIRTSDKQTPLIIVYSAMFFNLVNANLLGYSLTHFADYPPDYGFETIFQTGVVLFFVGFYINGKSDSRLIRMRKQNASSYSIPQGWLYRWISCPNYFGEMIEWLGFALICSNLAAWSFFVWTVANLLPRALKHHHWYTITFPDYPAKRKAIVPFVL